MNFTARIKYALPHYDRSARYKPNYVLNVSIDIPLKPSQLQSDHHLTGQFKFSPNQFKKKLKVEVPSARTTREGESRKISYLGDTQRTISYLNNQNKKKTTKCQMGHGSANQSAIKKCKHNNHSEAISPKNRKKQARSSKGISSNTTIRNSKIIHRLASESEDNIIRYTNQSSELKKELMANRLKMQNLENRHLDCQNNKSFQSSSKVFMEPEYEKDEQGLISQIRQFESKAQQKKQHLNYLYIKEKLLVLASARKIQRAWRNYKTKKILRSYSHDISLKFTNKMKNLQSGTAEHFNLLSVRSCGIGNKNGGNQLKKSAKVDLVVPQLNNYQKSSSSSSSAQEGRSDGSLSARMKFQLEEIQRWEELIKNIRQGNKVQEVLQKSFKRKSQLERELHGYSKINNKSKIVPQISVTSEQKIKSKKNCNFFGQQQKNSKKISKFQEPTPKVFTAIDNFKNLKEKIKETVELSERSWQEQEYESDQCNSGNEDEDNTTTQRNRKRRLQFFENQIRKIDNQGSESNYTYSQTSEHIGENSLMNSHDSPSSYGVEIEENKRLKKKLDIISKLNLMQNDKDEQHSIESVSITEKNNIEREKLSKNKEVTYFPSKLKGQQSLQAKLNKQQDKLETYRQSSLSPDIPYQMHENSTFSLLHLHSLRKEEKEDLISRLEEEMIYEILLEFSDSKAIVDQMELLFEKRRKREREEKPEGICTNLESIKDYLENFVAFVIEQHSKELIEGLARPAGPTPEMLLRFIRGDYSDSDSVHCRILPQRIFDEHWAYASEQIYFDPKYSDILKEKQRVNSLKTITKVYFKSIFDGFNECLQFHRSYGQQGKPFPWIVRLKEKQVKILTIQQIKPVIRTAYKKLSQLAVVYCGLHIEDKKLNMSQNIIQEIQQERINTLLEIEMRDDEFRWHLIDDELTEILCGISQKIWDQIIEETIADWMTILPH